MTRRGKKNEQNVPPLERWRYQFNGLETESPKLSEPGEAGQMPNLGAYGCLVESTDRLPICFIPKDFFKKKWRTYIFSARG
jgi:hypothetical protein